MTFFPDSKTFLQIGSLSIAWYAILIITGAFIAYKIGQHNFKKMGYNKDILSDYFIFKRRRNAGLHYNLSLQGGDSIWNKQTLKPEKASAYLPTCF